MDVLDQNTYKRRYSDIGCDFFQKNIIFTKNAVSYEEKLFFAFFLQFVEKNRVLKKAEGN